jgi:hypothetical protein
VQALPPPAYGVSAAEIQGLFADTRTRTRNLFETWLTDPNLGLRPGGGQEAMNGADWLVAYGKHESVHQQQIDTLIAQWPGRADQNTSDQPC